MEGLTVGVLSTTFGGAYFGELLAAIRSGIASRGGRLVAIQTLDAGSFGVDVQEPPADLPHVAWDHLDALIVFLNAVTPDFMRQARDRGLPVVVISDLPKGFDCPVLAPDNRAGARAATEHLIAHGHTAIGFVGSPRHNDIRERQEAYRATMLEHGLPLPEQYFFETANLQLSGGAGAADAMLAAGMPCTAVVVGNDDNAIGLMRALAGAGLDLPRDLAVIGFDDSIDATYLSPPLTSVRQPLEELGTRAVDLVVAQLEGRVAENGLHELPTRLALRESCGCDEQVTPAPGAGPAASSILDGDELTERIRLTLQARLPIARHPDPADVELPVLGIAGALRSTAASGTAPDPADLRRNLAGLSRLVHSKEHVLQIMGLIQLYVRFLPGLSSGEPGHVERRHLVDDCLGRVHAGLVQALATRQAELTRSMVVALSTQYAVSMELLRSQERDPRSLHWLRLTPVRAGCLGLWPDHQRTSSQREHVEVVAVYDREQDTVRRYLGPLALERFPPAEVLELADPAGEDIVFVAHLKVESGDWGMLTLIGPVQVGTETGRESLNQWSALLSVALEHEAVLSTLRRQEEHLRRAALYDELTAMPNRAYFRDRLTLAMARATRRAGYRYAVLMLDLDGFKLVNDSFGHVVGDRLLQQVADRITADLRVLDTGARFGGDEFAVLLEEIEDEAAAIAIAERLHRTLAPPFRLHDTEVVVTASIGIALGTEEHTDTETIVRNADAAMYHAKSLGRGRHALFDPSMHESALNRLRLEGELRRALKKNELQLHYQPITDLATGLMSGAEALIRWQHPTRGLLAPGAFLTIAEESGLILGIGTWILAEACRQMREWGLGEPGARAFTMSLNVSNRQFWQSDVVGDIAGSLTAFGLTPDRLAVEITEGVIMHDVKQASSVLDGLHTVGVQVHIDDFGTGYSSLEALHDLSIDALKIDRSFVSRMTSNPRSRELVRTIVTMGHNLDVDVIAEGIETQEELGLVRLLGCTHGQGYLYSPPIPAEQFAVLLRDPGPPR